MLVKAVAQNNYN